MIFLKALRKLFFRRESKLGYILAGFGVLIAVLFVFSMIKAGDCDDLLEM